MFAQSNAIDAAIEGYLRDASGGAIQGGRVTVRNAATNVATQTTTNPDGYFRFPLAPGRHVRDQSGRRGIQGLTQPNRDRSGTEDPPRPRSAESAPAPNRWKSRAEASIWLADTALSAVGGVVSRKEVEDLPIVSRNIYNFQLLAPGVQGLSSPTFGTTQFAFGGNERSSWNLDGLDNTQRGGSRQIRMVITTPEAVEEVQVLSNGYSAEFGRAAGGQVNVILKSGHEPVHGRSCSFTARRLAGAAFAGGGQSRGDLVGRGRHLGGPILKDRIFFFTQYEHNPYKSSERADDSARECVGAESARPPAGHRAVRRDVRHLRRQDELPLNDRNSGYVRYARFTNHQPNNASGSDHPDRGVNFDDHMNGGGVQLATVFSPIAAQRTSLRRIQRTQAKRPWASRILTRPLSTLRAWPISATTRCRTETTELSNQIIDNLTWTHGRSTWKAGVDFQHTISISSARAIWPTLLAACRR